MRIFPSLTIAAAMLVAILAGPLASSAVAQEAAPAAQTPVKVGSTEGADAPLPWTVSCSSNPQSGELSCSMTQVLVAQDTQQRLIGATVFRNAAGAAVMRFSLPHGVLLQKGVNVGVDDKAASTIPIVIADQNGSYADLEISPELLQGLQAGSALHLGVTAGTGEAVDFALSLKGFTAAFAKL